jgi:hypothetical protein
MKRYETMESQQPRHAESGDLKTGAEMRISPRDTLRVLESLDLS